MKNILDELYRAWEAQNKSMISSFSDSLSERCLKGVVVGIGAGRMGYSMRAFVMRLSHIGVDSYFIGDTGLPRIDSSSTVIINSSSGETPTMRLYAEQAKASGARVFLVTQNLDSSLGKLADHILEIPNPSSKQLMKSFAEQYTFLLFDYLNALIVEKEKIERDFIEHNHSILE